MEVVIEGIRSTGCSRRSSKSRNGLAIRALFCTCKDSAPYFSALALEKDIDMQLPTKFHAARTRQHHSWKGRPITAGLFICLTATPALPQSFIEVAANSAGAASDVVVTALTNPGQFVTVLANASDDLEAIAWQYETGSTLTVARQGTLSGGKVGGGGLGLLQELSVASISNNRFVIALSDSSTNLELIVCGVSSTGEVTRLNTFFTTTPVANVAITALDSQRVVTATTDTTQAIVTTWSVDDFGNISQQAASSTIAVPGFSIAVAAMSTSQVVVAQANGFNFQTGIGNPLALTSLGVDANGNITQQSTSTGIQATSEGYALSISVLPNSGDLAVYCLDPSQYPTMSIWNISSSGAIGEISWGGNNTGFAHVLAVTNYEGWPFTIDDSLAESSSQYQVNTWAGALSGVFPLFTKPIGTCSAGCELGNVSATTLPGGLFVTATANGYLEGLSVIVWEFDTL